MESISSEHAGLDIITMTEILEIAMNGVFQGRLDSTRLSLRAIQSSHVPIERIGAELPHENKRNSNDG
jgi:hypothetical protein